MPFGDAPTPYFPLPTPQNPIRMTHDKTIIWRSSKGDVIACVERNKVLQENLAEIRQVCQDALEDAILMGCDELQFRSVLAELLVSLENPYPPQE